MKATEAEVDTKLALCPFCGGVAHVFAGGPGNHFVQCSSCRATSDDRSRDQAIAAWNRRPALSTLQVQTSEADTVLHAMALAYEEGWQDHRQKKGANTGKRNMERILALTRSPQ